MQKALNMKLLILILTALAAISAGARQTECTINGIGERAGNAALEEIAAAMKVRGDQLPFTNGICMEQLYPTSQMLADCISFGPAPNKAVVGDNAFAHEAGIHQHGVLANPLCYEIMTPESVGVQKNRMVLGKHSGQHALALRCEQLGHQFDRRELDEIYRKFVVLADRIKKVQDSHLLELIQEVCAQGKRIPPAAASMPFTRAASAVVGSHEAPIPFPAPVPGNNGPASVAVTFSDHHSEQEDYLWGV